ncbi:MAG: M61 family metallopeptidase [Cyclobacteriaceae bacterium]|nr:M61 family metallopeptidase [Cyclobacteriaceae bacterium]
MTKIISLLITTWLMCLANQSPAQQMPLINYTVSVPQPATHKYHVELRTQGWNKDTLVLKMPKWMPGYYQIMDYAKSVENILIKDEKGKDFSFQRVSDNTLRISGIRSKTMILSYDVMTTKQFVANSYVDSEHAYLIPANSFFYVEEFLHLPVQVEIATTPWSTIATGLEPTNKANHFTVDNFDILYDCPILIGNLEVLPSFKINGIEHRFMGYKLGTFDKVDFMEKLKRTTEAAVAVIGDIPFKQYTYIAIGPGRGGIEHLNNTTVSFDGTSLSNAATINRMMNFLAHEYFHHYNVKRIRPFELGPFDYEKGSKTNLLWVSEGLSVYYEYLIVRRAGLMDERELLDNLEKNINAYENNPGRFYQSLTQASYNTWKDGPFGTQGDEPGKSISYYDKGPVVGMLLDFAIRHATQNKKSMDDVMKVLYWKYYKEKGRGFTDAEFEQTCEEVAGSSLARLFEYVYTTRELDYSIYLGYAGLKLEQVPTVGDDKKQGKKFTLGRIENPDALQMSILRSWQGEK